MNCTLFSIIRTLWTSKQSIVWGSEPIILSYQLEGGLWRKLPKHNMTVDEFGVVENVILRVSNSYESNTVSWMFRQLVSMSFPFPHVHIPSINPAIIIMNNINQRYYRVCVRCWLLRCTLSACSRVMQPTLSCGYVPHADSLKAPESELSWELQH